MQNVRLLGSKRINNTMNSFCIVWSFIALSCISNVCYGCGITTHIEISHRAQTYFKDDSQTKTDYAKMIQTHLDALMAGSPYPDAYYDDVCANGEYHDVSEDTHWAPFLNATVNYINTKYPQPWDEATEKLVVFMFGVVSHQVADILWHSLGIEQGFLQTMANINFHGRFSDAHPVGDLGGDILTVYEMDTTYIPLEQGWYIPVDDLFNIYTNYYNGNYSKMPSAIIQECTLTLFLGRLAELIGGKELYREYAEQSPFLVDQFEKFFIGGVDDMAGWTNRIWQQTITMIEKGTADCDIPQSTLFLHCNQSSPKLTGYRKPGKNGYFTRPSLKGMSREDIVVEKTLRGIQIKPSTLYMEKLRKYKLIKAEAASIKRASIKQELGDARTPNAVLFVNNDNARLGEAYATGDLNSDGHPDLVISAPGYGTAGSPQEGRVYIIYGTADGIPQSVNPDLDELENAKQGQIMKGFGTAQSRFGTAVAVVDINLDGVDDIAVGAPALVNAGDDPLQYHGMVLIYFGSSVRHEVARGAANITIACDKIKYCNLGYTLTVGDVNNDNNPDLVVGAPFAPTAGGSEQIGFVAALFASKYNTGYQYMDVGQLKWSIRGDQNNSWFGYDLNFVSWNNKPTLLVGQPEFRKCYRKDCQYDFADTQSSGKLTAFHGGQNLSAQWVVQEEYNVAWTQIGWSSDLGSPYPDKSTQVFVISEVGYYVDGSLFGDYFSFLQAGKLRLYNTTNGFIPEKLNISMEGDRMYDRFGAKVKFFDINADGMSDLLVGAPLRSEDISEEFFGADQGQVYVYLGGENFPYPASEDKCGNSIVRPCPKYQASYTLLWNDELPKARFGSNFGFLKSQNGSQVFVTAQHASNIARLAGAVGMFNF